MVAYSFKKRFVPPIVAGLEPGPWLPGMKRQTIRADRKRHAHAGEEMQLYTAMRTKSCKLLGKVTCENEAPVRLNLLKAGGSVEVPKLELLFCTPIALDAFARQDGFEDWADLILFWRSEHESVLTFDGRLLLWRPKGPSAP